MVSLEWKNAEAFEQMAARGSAGRDLGQLDEPLIQDIYKYLPPISRESHNEVNSFGGRPHRCA
jgi:hypothetical protein